jgi:hypothetical protein
MAFDVGGNERAYKCSLHLERMAMMLVENEEDSEIESGWIFQVASVFSTPIISDCWHKGSGLAILQRFTEYSVKYSWRQIDYDKDTKG